MFAATHVAAIYGKTRQSPTREEPGHVPSSAAQWSKELRDRSSTPEPVMSLTAAGKSFQEDAKGFTQSREHSHTVIVIGSGVAGLLTALHLSMKPGLGFHATIIADEPPPPLNSEADTPRPFEPLDLSDEVMRYLDVVKLRSHVASCFCHPDAKAVRSWDGTLLQWTERPHPIADTHEFRRILINVAVERGVQFMWNTRVIDMADVGWGVVCLLGDRSQTAADLLVGCDGPQSMVRMAVEGGPDARRHSDPSGVLAFSAEFRDSAGALLSLVEQTQHFYGPNMTAHVCLFNDGLYKFQIYVSSAIDAKTSDNRAELKDGPLPLAYRNLMVLARMNSPASHLIRLLSSGTACPKLCRHICNIRPPLTRLAAGRMVVLGSASMAHDSPCFRPSLQPSLYCPLPLLWLIFFAVLPYIARQLSMLTSLMAKKAVPQQLGETLNDFSAAFLPVAQAESCEFETLERQIATVRP